VAVPEKDKVGVCGVVLGVGGVDAGFVGTEWGEFGDE